MTNPQALREAVVMSIIGVYNTGRPAHVTASEHVLSKSVVQRAFDCYDAALSSPSTTVATAVTQGDARGIVEQCAKVADTWGERSTTPGDPTIWHAIGKSVGEDIRNAAPEIIAALPAGEVEPVAYVCEADMKALSSKAEGDDLSISPTPRPDLGMNMALYATPPSVIPAAAVGELHERIMQGMWASESEEGDLHSSFRLGTFQRLAHAAIRALPTPSEGLTERYREARDCLHQIKNMDPQEMAKSTWFVRQLVDEAIAALSNSGQMEKGA